MRGFRQPPYDAVAGDLSAQTLDLVVLSGKARDRQGCELGELRDLLVAGDDARFELGISSLESFTLRDRGMGDLCGVAEFVKPALGLLGEVLPGAGPVVASRFFLGHRPVRVTPARAAGVFRSAFPPGGRSPFRIRCAAARIADSLWVRPRLKCGVAGGRMRSP
ncbi:hypothetical protein ACWC2K_19525 [Streptomyces chattanoogensis]